MRGARRAGAGLVLLMLWMAPATAQEGRYRGPIGEVLQGPIPHKDRFHDGPGTHGAVFPGVTLLRFDPEGWYRWEFWWENDKDSYLAPALLARAEEGSVFGSPEFFLGGNAAAAGALDRSRLRAEAIPALIEVARAGDPDLRAAAAMALGRLGPSDALPFLETLTRDPKPVVRRGALLGLGLMGDEAALPAIIESYEASGRSPDSRPHAALALGLSGRPEARPVLLRRLAANFAQGEHREEPQLLASVLSLGLVGDASDVPFLLERLAATRSPVTQSFLLRSIGSLGDLAVVPRLLEALATRDLALRRGAALALARLRIPFPAAEQLREALARQEEAERSGVLSESARARLRDLVQELRLRAGEEQVLVEGVRQKVVKTLAGLLGRGVDLQVREFAALALGRIGSAAAAGPLLEALDSNVSRNLKVFAALGLGFLGDPSHAGAIREYLRSHYEYGQKGGMCIALGLLGDRASIPILEMLVRDQMPARTRMLARLVVAPELRGYAAMGLALMGARELAPLMRDELRKKPRDPDLGRAFSLAIGVLGCPDAAPLLLDVLRKASLPSVKGSAAMGLGYLKDPASVKPLLEMLGKGTEPVENRIYTALALGVLGQGRNGGALARIALDYDYRIQVGALDEVLGIF